MHHLKMEMFVIINVNTIVMILSIVFHLVPKIINIYTNHKENNV